MKKPDESEHTQIHGSTSRGEAGSVTEGFHFHEQGFDPVVGWLVCVAGPEKGRDYRIRSENNYIGRAPTMHIVIQGDPAISREKHALLTFDPEDGSFTISRGQARGLVRLGDDLVQGATPLHFGDHIRLGQSEFRFIPFCVSQEDLEYMGHKTTNTFNWGHGQQEEGNK